MLDITETIHTLLPELTALRHELHTHPEIRFEEHWTSARIQQFLTQAGIPFTTGHAKGTGIVATIQGPTRGRTIALRADIDALEINEQTNLPYASQIPDRMHACGHDGHTTILCGTAKTLWTHRDQLKGRVKLIFQPAEEQAAGGRFIVQEGLLDDVDAAFALHCWPDFSVGTAGCGDGHVMASADWFSIDIIGRGGHGADPSAAIDPVLIAAHIVTALQAIVSREVHPWESAVVNVASIHTGNASNVIPGSATLEGTFRALREDTRIRVAAAIERIAWHTAAAFGAQANVEMDDIGYPMLHNDPKMAQLARTAITKALGPQNLTPVTHPYMTAEDFAYYLQRIPGAFIFLGNRPPDTAPQDTPTLHSPHFNFNDQALLPGIQTLTQITTNFLQSN